MKKKSITILLAAVMLASLFLSCSPKKEEAVQAGPLTYEDFVDSSQYPDLEYVSITDERKKSVLSTDSIYDVKGGIVALDPASYSETDDYISLSGKKIGVLTGAFYDIIVKEKLGATPVYYQNDTAALEDVRNGRIDGVMYDYSTARVINNRQGNEAFEVVAIPHGIHSGPMGAISASQETIDRFNGFLEEVEEDGALDDMRNRWLEENPGSDPPMPDIPFSGENGTLKIAVTGLTMPFTYTGANSELKGFCIELALRFAAYEGKTVEFAPMDFSGVIPFFGTVFGCFICWLLLFKNRLVKWFGNFYCGLIHGTPIVVLLMITYYIIFGDTEISNVLIAVAAFTMITGAGVAGILRGAIDTVDPLEIEAARGIGFSSFKAFCEVTLPQAVRRAMPGYTNGFVELVKATAIVGYIAIQDLTRAGDIIRSRTYDAYFPLLLVAIIYLTVTTICVQLFKLIIKRVNGGEIN